MRPIAEKPGVKGGWSWRAGGTKVPARLDWVLGERPTARTLMTEEPRWAVGMGWVLRTNGSPNASSTAAVWVSAIVSGVEEMSELDGGVGWACQMVLRVGDGEQVDG